MTLPLHLSCLIPKSNPPHLLWLQDWHPVPYMPRFSWCSWWFLSAKVILPPQPHLCHRIWLKACMSLTHTKVPRFQVLLVCFITLLSNPLLTSAYLLYDPITNQEDSKWQLLLFHDRCVTYHFIPAPFNLRWDHLSDIQLTDPDFGCPGRIDNLLEVDVFNCWSLAAGPVDWTTWLSNCICNAIWLGSCWQNQF